MQLSETQKQKVKRFLGDKEMERAVYHVLFETFIKREKRDDVQLTAARTIAIDLLQDAWRELEVQKDKVEFEQKPVKQVGL